MHLPRIAILGCYFHAALSEEPLRFANIGIAHLKQITNYSTWPHLSPAGRCHWRLQVASILASAMCHRRPLGLNASGYLRKQLSTNGNYIGIVYGIVPDVARF
ncbi:hypothetical protein BGW80DRAFT_520324 [Lactifluus volemus]|nr:hypothetical protein BGW80DRAFT_520324 [Lactifluus volemus]